MPQNGFESLNVSSVD